MDASGYMGCQWASKNSCGNSISVKYNKMDQIGGGGGVSGGGLEVKLWEEGLPPVAT